MELTTENVPLEGRNPTEIIGEDWFGIKKERRLPDVGSTDELDSLKGRVQSGGRICAANSLGNIVKHTH